MTGQVQKSNLVEVPGDQVVEHSVPQELKALVAVSQAIRIVGGMRKGLRQDRGEESTQTDQTWSKKHLSRHT